MKVSAADRWLSVVDAAEYFGGGVMRVYRRIWAGQLVVSNVAMEGSKPNYRVSLKSIDKYFSDRQLTAPSRGLAK
ncbi:hypothetical protein [Rhizocola hellebori]|uniref:hypothetical protein n=1 Tax=Rhizocola hellebori TaxID=1392758 RepID=UPI001945ADD3|nr:hypothetical protein [Rhizocola hellebori]